MRTPGRRPAFALALWACLVVVYNANGREIGSVDSQPVKYTARELALRGTLRLDQVIEELPGLAERPAFAVDRQGHYRSAYPVLPGLLAAVAAILLQGVGLIDMEAPLASSLIAALTASTLTAAAVALVFLALCRLVPVRVALTTAIGLGVGTNFWPVISQTMWRHETVAFGCALALWAGLRPAGEAPGHRRLWIAGLGLAMAGAARPQVAPLVAVLLLWLAARSGRAAWRSAVVVAAVAALDLGANYRWFGHVLGATPSLEAVHATVHDVSGSFGSVGEGLGGLLASPSRGLLIFSPVVFVAALGALTAWRRPRPQPDLWWLLLAAAVQLVAYAAYAVWWGGHTYGPRYAVDILVPLAPAGALGALWMSRRRWASAVGLALLAWSVVVAGAGAFVFPNERWNTSPADVDRNHERLWQVRDTQIPRTLRTPLSPQNFGLFDRAAFRIARDTPDR